jgi:hypothetical protein
MPGLVADRASAAAGTAGALAGSRFDFAANLAAAGCNRESTRPLWPPDTAWRRLDCSLGPEMPDAPLGEALDALREVVEASLHDALSGNGVAGKRMPRAQAVASLLRRIAHALPRAADRRALSLRADAVERGYDEASLAELATLREDIAFVAGNISTWFGKHRRGLPTAFGCHVDPFAQGAVDAVAGLQNEIAAYLRALCAALRLGSVPAYAATRLFFMAGEGNTHPKHIAYFVPEDEGVKKSPFKKTYYFANSHRALIDAAAIPLARCHLDIGIPPPVNAAAYGPLPSLGVFAHEIGHAVHRETTRYAGLNDAHRWMSVAMQEMAADVFGMLILTEVFCPALGIEPERAVAYHLGECLRYIDRGLGRFPDSDGMYLQLSYLSTFGVLSLHDGADVVLCGTPDAVLAGFRSLGRVLADTLLATDIARTEALFRDFSPEADPGGIAPLIAALTSKQPASLAYSP